MKNLLIVLVNICFVLCNSAQAGLSYSDSESHKFRYDVKGEITVRPDRAVFPVMITAKSKSYQQSLQLANQLLLDFKEDSKKLDNGVFSITSENFYRNNKRSKINLSFFGDGDDNRAATKLVAFLVVDFKDKHDFDARAKYIAEALDFIDGFSAKSRAADHVSVVVEDSFYEISDVEQYREQIVSSVYNKAKLMAGIIAKNEKMTPGIREVFFDQYIGEDIINFNKASLFINAKIEYGFK